MNLKCFLLSLSFAVVSAQVAVGPKYGLFDDPDNVDMIIGHFLRFVYTEGAETTNAGQNQLANNMFSWLSKTFGPSWRVDTIYSYGMDPVNNPTYFDSIKDCPVDLLIILDNSGSVASVFEEEKFIAISIVRSLRAEDVRLGLISFNNHANFTFNLSNRLGYANMLGKMENLAFEGETTNTAESLQLASEDFRQNLRLDAWKATLIVTDGFSLNSIEELKGIVAELGRIEVEMFVATASDHYDLREFLVLADGKSDRIFTTQNITKLHESVMGAKCQKYQKGENIESTAAPLSEYSNFSMSSPSMFSDNNSTANFTESNLSENDTNRGNSERTVEFEFAYSTRTQLPISTETISNFRISTPFPFSGQNSDSNKIDVGNKTVSNSSDMFSTGHNWSTYNGSSDANSTRNDSTSITANNRMHNGNGFTVSTHLDVFTRSNQTELMSNRLPIDKSSLLQSLLAVEGNDSEIIRLLNNIEKFTLNHSETISNEMVKVINSNTTHQLFKFNSTAEERNFTQQPAGLNPYQSVN